MVSFESAISEKIKIFAKYNDLFLYLLPTYVTIIFRFMDMTTEEKDLDLLEALETESGLFKIYLFRFYIGISPCVEKINDDTDELDGEDYETLFPIYKEFLRSLKSEDRA